MITAPTESRSKFNAKPYVLPGNSIISPCITSLKPCILATPSARLTTVPSVRASVSRSSSLIFFLIKSLISVALIDICLSSFKNYWAITLFNSSKRPRSDASTTESPTLIITPPIKSLFSSILISILLPVRLLRDSLIFFI